MNDLRTAVELDEEVTEAVRRRRLELGRFLKHRRGKLSPTEIGLSGGGRRHVRGLRRDEVAEAASIGVSWYAMLEQGRAENVTRETLDGIAEALRLTPAERQYLQQLADAAFTAASNDLRTPPEELVAFVRAFRNGGAFIHSSRCDLIAWNEFAEEQFHFSKHGSNPNLLRVMLDEASLRERLIAPTWDEIFGRMIGNFRRLRGHFGDASHERLIDELSHHPEFARRWQRHPVMPPPSELGLIDHPTYGRLDVSVIAFSHPSCPTYQIVLDAAAQFQRAPIRGYRRANTLARVRCKPRRAHGSSSPRRTRRLLTQPSRAADSSRRRHRYG